MTLALIVAQEPRDMMATTLFWCLLLSGGQQCASIEPQAAYKANVCQHTGWQQSIPAVVADIGIPVHDFAYMPPFGRCSVSLNDCHYTCNECILSFYSHS
ncbi:hypothetical protein MN608_07912 [Microdochium nivale]|nr:hypothetical protein MN608_07912 [Microdochium nivale]